MSEVKSVDIRGLVDTYEFPCELPGSGQKLMIRPITTGQMKKMLAYENETDPYVVEQALDGLIMGCVASDGFNVGDLFLQDRFYLLLEIRKVSKGNNYSFNFKCPKCGVDNLFSTSLDELEVTKKNSTSSIIPVNDKLQFEINFPTRADQKDAIKRVSKLKGLSPSQKAAEVVTYTMSNAVKNVHTLDGVFDNIPFEDKVYILDNVKSDIFDEFKDWLVDNDFGVKFELDVSCVECDYSDKMEIPLENFFG